MTTGVFDMTTNREAMTLEQVRDLLDMAINVCGGSPRVTLHPTRARQARDCIDAHLRAAEPVGTLIVEPCTGNQFGRTARVHLDMACMDCPIGEHPIYTHPSEDARCPYIVTGMEGTSHCRLAEDDARGITDAKVKRVARAIYAHVFNISIPRMGVRTATFEEVWAVPTERERLQLQARAAIDAAMNGGDDE